MVVFPRVGCRHQASTVVSDRQSAFRAVLILRINVRI